MKWLHEPTFDLLNRIGAVHIGCDSGSGNTGYRALASKYCAFPVEFFATVVTAGAGPVGLFAGALFSPSPVNPSGFRAETKAR
ncbi:MAG: hypothetical protein H7A53_13925 [Akkermansiaceae bacterium]|nr:hypothetical protein [Akkermansiaceae bacterium]